MFKRLAFLLLLLFAVALSVGSLPASAASPWWHLTSGALPSYLPADVHPEKAVNEVQDVTVTGKAGELFVLANMSESQLYECFISVESQCETGGHEPLFEVFFVGEGASAVQKGLEKIGGYAPGNVEVTENTTAQQKGESTYSYLVTFKGTLGDQLVPPINVEPNEIFGLPTKVAVTQVTQGVADGPIGELVVTANNLGNADTNGEVTVVDKLPAGLRAISAEAIVNEGTGEIPPPGSPGLIGMGCKLSAVVTCKLGSGTYVFEGVTHPNRVIAYGMIQMHIKAIVEPGAKTCESNSATCEQNEVSIAGGGAPSLSISRPVTVSAKPTPYGVSTYEVTPEEEGGAPTTQAGKHPFQATGTLMLNQHVTEPEKRTAAPIQLPRDIAGLLPPGLIGNPAPVAKCALAQFYAQTCPQASVLGIAGIEYEAAVGRGDQFADEPMVNLEPGHGEAARFGFLLPSTPVFLDVHVRTGEDYGVTLSSSDITQLAGFLSYRLTFWGVPGEAAHDTTRGISCLITRVEGETQRTLTNNNLPPCTPMEGKNPPPFLSMPTSCTGPLHTSAETDAWEDPLPEGKRLIFPETAPMPAMDGCNRLPFEPSIKATPDGSEASTPTGLNVDVHVPQDSVLNANSLAESNVKDIKVALPEGVAINPAGGGGLEACSEQLVGYEGTKAFETSPSVSVPAFTAKIPGSFGSGEALEPGVNFCANASKIGTVKLKTPFLPKDLEGSVYLASQEANPFGSLVAMYIVAEDPESGVVVKLAGQVELSEAGQLVASFDNSPQAAFEDAELHFFGGERAPLASPSRCGAYTTNASFVPWTAESFDEATQTVSASSTYEVTSGPHGTPCPGASLPFAPTLTAGTTSNQAGGFSQFTMTMSRKDGEQHLQAIELHMPPGMSGTLAGVALCPEAQANEGTCGANSLIGETTVSVGVGGDPFTVTGGKVYLTGPYKGAPFGLSIVNPAKAGPFDLEDTKSSHPPCDCLVVRAKIEVNQLTAALTITSDNSGPYKIPTTLDGIPLQIQHVNVTVNRPEFTFNPTDCNKLEITGNLSSTEGANRALSVPFQATNCAVLAFKPKLTATTSGKTSRAAGASLSVKLTYPAGPYDANISKVKVDLPKQLPSRLTTLQKACTAAQFESNPAGCPSASIIGHATATTPVLPVPLTGPAYFVSHGGEAFPSLIVVLQGYGVTVHLVGTTFISKSGITSSTFKAVPDVPVGTFELTLPEGKYSALAANGNLCESKLAMPTAFDGQNGAEIHTSTKITPTGCAKPHKAKKHKAKEKKRKTKKK
jgi:uncharacterized repeat protein (TIGR01451 family)